ncbi:hypothetical protein B0H13DRAFT_2344845 [Mycena leptocephala]|nr:hypothetical protein B0H13DRAFT_2344845 [Mycena leptocephala]
MSLTSIAAEFRGSIAISILQIFDLLKDSCSYVRMGGAEALSKLSEQAEFRGLIGTSIPQIIDLLKDSDSDVRIAGAESLSKLTEQAEFRGSIGTSTPQIVDLLKDSNIFVRMAGANVLSNLLEQGKASPFSSSPLKERFPRSSVQPRHETVIIQKIDSDFRYRVWFTWHLMQTLIPGTDEAADRRQEEFWVTAVSRTDMNGDLWFWENGDEEYIKAFTEDHLLKAALEIPMVDWTNACRALDARQPESRLTASPLSHLTPQTRLLFIAWLIVAERGRMHLQNIIACWGSPSPTPLPTLRQKNAIFVEFHSS